ncbi:MAG: integrase arm-type DNA-binding domain-containing protein [Burkholderiales bacterium]
MRSEGHWGLYRGTGFQSWGHLVLTDRACKAAEPAEKNRKLFDADGLFLLVTTTGFKSWRLKYRFGGKEKQLTFGPYPSVTLKEARQKKDEARRDLIAGRDPGATAKTARARRLGKEEETGTFRAAALQWLTLQEKGWRSKHHAHVKRSLERDIFPSLAALPLATIRPSDIRPLIAKVQERGAVDTAHRLLWRIQSIFDLAIASGDTEMNPAASINAILQPNVQRHYPAILDIKRARSFLLADEQLPGQPATKLASRLLALTACRPGPLRLAQASEFIDLVRVPSWHCIPRSGLEGKWTEDAKAPSGVEFVFSPKPKRQCTPSTDRLPNRRARRLAPPMAIRGEGAQSVPPARRCSAILPDRARHTV